MTDYICTIPSEAFRITALYGNYVRYPNFRVLLYFRKDLQAQPSISDWHQTEINRIIVEWLLTTLSNIVQARRDIDPDYLLDSYSVWDTLGT